MSHAREDGREPDEVRPIKIVRNFLKFPHGSVWIEQGDTKLVCTATADDYLPPHRKNSGGGWVTAEYAMIPGATMQRSQRETFGRSKGRSQEIQRLIGRSLRAVVDMDKLGERSLLIDADVIQADGGTRCAAINGCFVALHDAVARLRKEKKIKSNPIVQFVGAVSVGIIGSNIFLDLPYSEDVSAKVDMNVVMTESGSLVEVQGTAEGSPFSRKQLDAMLEVAWKGIREIIKAQKEALEVK